MRFDWKPHLDRLGKQLDTETARALTEELGVKVTKSMVQNARRRYKIKAHRPPTDYLAIFYKLGSQPDSVVAAELGVTARAVCYARARRWERAYMGGYPQRKPKGIKWDEQDPTEPAAAQAERLGVSVPAVLQARARRGR